MLLTEGGRPFTDDSFLTEVKWDGWRVTALASKSGVSLRSRNGADATRWFPEVSKTLLDVANSELILDGEMCVLDEKGRSDFDKLQTRALKRRYDPKSPVVYCVFDVLVSRGKSVMDRPLSARKKLLEPLRGLPSLLVVDGIVGHGEALYQQVLALELEGLVAKRLDSIYQPGVRSSDWIKIKRPGAVPPQRFKRSRGAS